MINKELWDKILNFDLDPIMLDYTFSIRLASENNWTRDFTNKAILEYKKFMYLIAISDEMLSPSEIVDIVWHQHLVFTESYNDFCKILGKQVKHIPSTHSKEESDKFKKSKERTRTLYLKEFGKIPASIWDSDDMYSILKLDKSKLKLKTFIIFSVLSFILISIPFSIIIKPIYSKINNPDFLIYFIFISIIAFVFLEFFNRKRLNKILNDFSKDSFIFNFTPFELIYMKTQKISSLINGIINDLVNRKNILINDDKTLEFSNKNNLTNSIEYKQVITTLGNITKSSYRELLSKLSEKPIFLNIKNSVDNLKKYFIKSEKFSKLFYINFFTLYTIFILLFSRVLTGIYRNKPIFFVLLLSIFFVIISFLFLKRLSNLMITKIIPNFYEKNIVNEKTISENWQWSYLLSGEKALLSSFLVVLTDFEISNRYGGNTDFSSDTSGSSGSSCGGGSSCGSSCGGCGGGD